MSDSESSDGEVDFKPMLDIESLPQVVKNRLNALKNIQLEYVQAEAEYYKEVQKLDLKYQAKYDEFNQSRLNILNGSFEPSGAQIEWKYNKEEETGDDLVNGVEKLKIENLDENTKGIPKFWMYVLKNANEDALMGLIEPHDEPVLEYLTDITVDLNKENANFTLKFHFSENPFFTNSVLTKDYILREGPDMEDPLQYGGPEIINCKGCEIDWKPGKDLTKQSVTIKKLKGKKGPKSSPDKKVTKEVKADSFFNFFSPPEVKEDEDQDGTDATTLAIDYDVGYSIKEKIIPRAVLYFTGEMYDDDEDDYDDCDDSDDEGGDTEEEEN